MALEKFGGRSQVKRFADGLERGLSGELASDQAAYDAGESRGRHRGEKRRPPVDHQHRDVRAAFELLVQRGHLELLADQIVVEHPRKIGRIGDGDWHRRIEALVLTVEPFVARHAVLRRRLTREGRGPIGNRARRQHAEHARRGISVLEHSVGLFLAEQRRDVRRLARSDRFHQLRVAGAVETKDDHPRADGRRSLRRGYNRVKRPAVHRR